MFERIITSISKAIVVAALFAMIVLSFAQIILRNFFDSGISWADVTVRHLVLWVGFFGAVIATVSGRHITLDIFSRVIPEGARRYVSAIVGLGSSAVCVVLAYASFRFVESERVMGSELFAGVPAWLAQTVIPVCFALMAAVFAGRVLSQARHSRPRLKHLGGNPRFRGDQRESSEHTRSPLSWG